MPDALMDRRGFLRGRFTPSEPQVRPIRTPDNPIVLDNDTQRRAALTTPPFSVLLLNRAGYGPRPGDIAAFEALGADDDARLAAYLAEQLDPASIDDSAVDAKIAAAGYQTTAKSLTELWTQHLRADVEWRERSRPAYESRTYKWVRAMHSKRQLFEVMADFWHNHFSTYAFEDVAVSTFMAYDRDVIRANALGNFHDLLVATAKSTTMLFYLDNAFSSADGPNENYARELLELHALGSEHYFGSMAPEDVPGYPNPEGYVEADVFAVTKILTGWTVKYRSWISAEEDTGEFEFRDEMHDTSEKQVLGQVLPAGQTAEQDGTALFNLLAVHPGTAQFICRKLVRRFVADFPPESLVTSAAAVFAANIDAPDQIAQVVEHILSSAEFKSSWGLKMKRPHHAAMSALRVGNSDYTFRVYDDSVTDTFVWFYHFAGHMPFQWHPPNGYPDIAGVWQSTSSLLMRWRCLNWMVDHADNGVWLLDLLSALPSDVRTASAITDFWINRIFGYAIADTTRQYLVDFMAQGRNPDFALPFDSDEDVRDRMRALVGLMFMSPEFQIK